MSIIHRFQTLALTMLLGATFGLASAPSAQAADPDFGPFYAVVGGTMHIAEVSGFDDSFGFNIRVGARETEWFGYEFHYEYISQFDGPSFVPNLSKRRSFDQLELHSLMPLLRFRYKIGFVEPYALVGGGLLIGDVTTVRNPRRTDLGIGVRTGAGLQTSFDFPVNAFAEYTRVFAGGRTTLYDFSSLAFGLEGRF